MPQNLLDRAISYVSPLAGMRRMAARFELQAAAAYEAAGTGRERPSHAWGRSMPGPEEKNFTTYDRANTVLECRDLYRNNEIAAAAIKCMGDYVVHAGIMPQAQTTDEKWNDSAERFMGGWMQRADYRERQGVTFAALQRACVVERHISGELGFLLISNGQLQPIEMDRVATPGKFASDAAVKDGIRYGPDGRPQAYYVCERFASGSVNTGSFETIDPRNFIHVYRPWRIEQARGVPELAPVVGKLADYRETDKYILLKIKNDAKQFLKRFKKSGGGFVNLAARNSTTVADSAGNQQRVEAYDWGNVWNLKEGEDLDSFEGRTPNPQVVPYLEHEAKAISAAIRIPVEFLMMCFTAGSYSAQRSAILHALHTFSEWHAWLNCIFNQRVWNWRIAMAIRDGELDPAPVDERGVSQWNRVVWSMPAMGWVDPEAQIKSEIQAWQLGTRSLKDIAVSSGRGDRGDLLRAKGEDIRFAQRVADELNQADPQLNLRWTDLINTGATPEPVAVLEAPK